MFSLLHSDIMKNTTRRTSVINPVMTKNYDLLIKLPPTLIDLDHLSLFKSAIVLFFFVLVLLVCFLLLAFVLLLLLYLAIYVANIEL